VETVRPWKTVRGLLAQLRQSKEEGGTLLDSTAVWGATSAMAAATPPRTCPSSLPAVAFVTGSISPSDPDQPPPLCNLYVSMLQHLGIATDEFSTSTGTLSGLDLKAG